VTSGSVIGPVTIRPRSPADLDAIVTLALETLRWHAEQWTDLRPPPTAESLRSSYAQVSEDDGGYFHLAECDGAVVGFLSARVTPQPEGGMERHDGPVVWISDVVVTVRARRAGVASQLMTHLETWAQERGAATITLHVHAGNEAALALYQRLGYQEAWIRMRKDMHP
jgi:ribosomal protein S18 acetylase RimI-like enzyme